MVVTLALLDGPRKGYSVTFAAPGRYVIGSSETADFRIPRDDDPHVSGRHALIEVTRSSCTIRSIAGPNPVIVNDEHVREKRLGENDVVQAGFRRIGVYFSIPYCYRCGGTDEALIESAESDGDFFEFREIAVHAHATCLRPDPEFAGRKIAVRSDGGDTRVFEIQARLGSGGFGSVSLAYDRKTSRLWAIKQMRGIASPEFAHRFKREGKFLMEFVHSRIARCVKMGEDPDGVNCLVCEYVPGRDLAKVVREKGPQPAWWAIDVVVQVLAGLHFLHTRPGVIVHRDVKPENVLLKGDGDAAAPLAKLADFGISRALEGEGSTRLTQAGAVPGTFSYLAPEVVFGNAYGPAADVYSAGVTAYYVLTGSHPYDFPHGAGDQALLSHLWMHQPFPIQQWFPGMPESLAAVIDKACRKDANNRFQTARELAQALMQIRNPSPPLDR